MATGRVAEALHLEQADLVQTTGEDVYYVTVVSGSLGEVVVELEHISIRVYFIGAKQ